jgi:phage regulator Rha-like protein
MKKKVIILIDGSNFYFKLKDLKLHDLLKCDFSKLVKYLAQDAQVVGTTFYIGKVRTDGTTKAQNLFNQQRKLLALLKKGLVTFRAR